jgi:hypothetical protein
MAVAIRDQQTGRVSLVPEDQAAALLADDGSTTGSTYEPVSQEEQDTLARQAYAETGLGMLETGARGAVDWAGRPIIGAVGRAMGAEGPLPSLSSIVEGGLTELGGASPLQAGQAIANSAEVGRGLEAANPSIYGLAEMGGQVGTALATGGLALGEGAAAATAAGLTRAGFGTAARVAGSTVGKSAAQGALEGAVDVVGRQLMDDPQSSAENILAGAGLGAILGGLGGAVPAGVMAGTGAAIRGGANLAERGAAKIGKTAKEAYESLAPKVQGQLDDAANEGGMTGAFRELQARTVAATNPDVPRNVVMDYGPGGRFSDVGFKASRDLDDVVDRGAQDLASTLNRSEAALNDVLDASRMPQRKLDAYRAQMSQADLLDPVKIRAVDDVITSTTAKMDEIGAQIDAAVTDGQLSSTAKRMWTSAKSQWEKAVKTAEEGGDLMDRAAVLELGKRRLQKAIKTMSESTENLRANGRLDDFAAADLKGIIDQLEREVQEPARLALETRELVGDALASGQREINSAYSQGGIRSMAEFRGAMSRRMAGGPDYFTGRDIYEVDPAKLKAIIQSRGKAEGVIGNRALDGYLTSADKLAELHGRHLGAELGEGYAGKVAVVQDSVSRARGELDAIRGTQEHAQNWRTLESIGVGPAAGLIIAGASMAGGLPGMLAGGIGAALLNPARTARLVTGLGDMFQRSGKDASALSKWIASGAAKLKAAAPVVAEAKAAAKEFGRLSTAGSAAIGTSAALQWYHSDGDNPGANFRKRLRQIERMDPASVASGLQRDGSVPREVAEALAAKSAQVRDYLLSKLPSAAAGGAIRPGIPYTPSKAEMETWGEIAAAAMKPQTVLSDIQSGQASPQQVQAVKDLYPAVFAGWQAAAVAGMAKADSDGVPIPIATRQRLSLLLDLDGAGDVTMSSQFGAQLGAAIAATRQQAQAAASAPPAPSPIGMQAQTPAMALFSA